VKETDLGRINPITYKTTERKRGPGPGERRARSTFVHILSGHSREERSLHESTIFDFRAEKRSREHYQRETLVGDESELALKEKTHEEKRGRV